MSFTLEERKFQYIEMVEAEYVPGEKTWWQHPLPSYHHTRDYAINYDKEVIAVEPVLFKTTKRTSLIAMVMVVVASLLLYMIGRKEFGFVQLLFLMLLLLVVLPHLLDNKTKIIVSRESIWLYKKDDEIRWKNIVLTYIKEVHGETSSFFFIVHYYDDGLDEFHRIEIELDGLVSPVVLSATIEAFKPA